MADVKEVIDGLEMSYKYSNVDGDNTLVPQLIVLHAIALLKEQKSEWLEDSDPGQEYGTTWACRNCWHSIHRPFVWNPYDSKMEYCPFCGAKMVVNVDA